MVAGLILTVYGEESSLAIEALESLFRTQDYPIQLVIVATNVTEAAVNRLKKHSQTKYYRLLTFAGKKSLTFCLNRGILYYLENFPTINYIGWIHPDMEFSKPYIATLIKRLEKDPSIGKISPNNSRDGWQEERQANEQCWIIPRRVFHEVGLFDENFSIGYEDWDLNRRVINAGYRCIVTPDAEVYHAGMVTRARENTTSREVMEKNAHYYMTKWGDTNAPC